MNDTTYIMEGDYGDGETARRREIRKDHNDGIRPHTALSASRMNALMRTWRAGPYQYPLWES